jgi:hypothetical protein
VLDNVRYQKCELVGTLASRLNIELLFLPAYSPNLNLIERLWKFVKKKVLYSKYYSDFGSFKRAISHCLSQTHTTYKKELDSLLTLKFQVFRKCNFVPIWGINDHVNRLAPVPYRNLDSSQLSLWRAFLTRWAPGRGRSSIGGSAECLGDRSGQMETRQDGGFWGFGFMLAPFAGGATRASRLVEAPRTKRELRLTLQKPLCGGVLISIRLALCDLKAEVMPALMQAQNATSKSQLDFESPQTELEKANELVKRDIDRHQNRQPEERVYPSSLFHRLPPGAHERLLLCTVLAPQPSPRDDLANHRR